MKKSIAVVLAVVLAVSTVVFCALWQRAVHDTSELEAFAQAEALKAYTYFTDYQSGKDNADYWQGVAAFHAFTDAYGVLTEGTNKSANRVFCDEVYSSLTQSLEQSQAHIEEIASVMKLLSEDITNETAHAKMLELRNTLEYN